MTLHWDSPEYSTIDYNVDLQGLHLAAYAFTWIQQSQYIRPYVALMFVQRCRRSANTNPSLVQCLVFAGEL